MSVLKEIFDWSETLPGWQSDAIARLFLKQTLTQEDLDELYALLKIEHGISDIKERTAVRLQQEQIPAPVKDDTSVKLLSIRDLKNVNAIAEAEKLNFTPTGLTVIYGDNGSGKSGYVRVLKRACRARDQSEMILPNANLAPSETGTARAVFDVQINGKNEEKIWIDDQPSPQILSAIAIFDQRCARAYIDEEDDFKYIPYGLDIPDGLANICRQFKGKLDSDLTQCVVDLTSFSDLEGPTYVGKLIKRLSATTSVQEVEDLANLEEEEISKHKALNTSLKEDDPKLKAQNLRLSASRIERMASTAGKVISSLDDSNKKKLQKLQIDFKAAQDAEKIAAAKFQTESHYLQGTGNETWRILFEAARNFSIEAYPEKDFPYIDKGAVCPLCQQTLEKGVKHLLHFEEFIKEETKIQALEKRRDFEKAKQDTINFDISLHYDGETLTEISTLDRKLADDIRKFEESISKRFGNIVAALSSHKWEEIGSITDTPVNRLNALSEKLKKQAVTYDKAANEETRAALKIEFNELDARVRLGKQKKAVLAAIGKFSLEAKLRRCIAAVKTDAISRKTRELTEKIISKKLEEMLNNEFRELGVGDLRVSLQTRIDKGKPLHKLILNLPQAKKIGDILSEGEKQAVAIGSFLAEINMNGSSGGLVFDDPVSSLDHLRRENVAKRLVKEASKRQIIVFTHELYFLGMLLTHAERAGVNTIQQTLTWRSKGCGTVEPDIPFLGKNTAARIGALRARQQDISKLYRDNDIPRYREETCRAYKLLRDTWERAVEEVLFRQVVMRFRKGVETSKLKEVSVEDPDYFRIEEAYTKCSNYCHDTPNLGDISVPHPNELLSDINELDNYRSELEKRSTDTRKKRSRNPN